MSRFLRLLAAGAALGAVSCSVVTVGDLPALTEQARKGDAAAARRLVEALPSPDRDLALAAYRAVLDAGAGCVPALLEKARSTELGVFEPAAAALANHRERKAVPDLLAALAEGGMRARPAAWALGMIGDPAAIAPLAAALSSSNPDLRKAAVRALVRMGEPVADEVTGVLKSGPRPETERAAIRVLGEIRARGAVPPLLAANESNRDAAVWALGRISDKAAADAVRKALADPRWQVRREAAQALGPLGDRSDLPALRRALDDPETVVREWAARSLMTLAGGEVLYRDENGKMVPPYNLYR